MAALDLHGAAALVTGGAGGFGVAVTERLVRSGAAVVIADIDARGDAVAAELGAVFVPTDVTSLTENQAAVAAAEARGPLRFVHVNAGVATHDPFEEVGEDEYRRVAGVNLDGVFWGIRAALPALRRAGGGAIVVTASLAGLVPVPTDPIYAFTKSAVVSLVRSLGPTLRAEGIRLNAICPGFADTPILPDAVRTSGYPLLTADEVADSVITIAGEDSCGEAFVLQPGVPMYPYRFRGVPGARAAGDAAADPSAGSLIGLQTSDSETAG